MTALLQRRRRLAGAEGLTQAPYPCLPARLDLDTAWDELGRSPFALVVRRRRVVGAVERHLLRRARRFALESMALGDLVNAPAVFVSPRSSVGAAARRLVATGQPFLLVGRAPARVDRVVPREALAAHMRGRDGAASRALGAVRFSALLRRHAGAGAQSLLRQVGRLAAAQGVRACLVGGVVRDLLLGRACADLDLVVEGDAPALATALAELRGGRATCFAGFGTARVELPDGRRIDLAGARRERYARPAALPQVRSGDLDADAWRRDLSINALAVRIDPGAFGRLLDPTGGLRDLARRRIRLLHGLSLIDDPTRAFRAVRFAARLGFELSAETLALIGVARRVAVFERLSSRRLGREVEAILSAPRAPRAVGTLAACGLLGALHPGLRLTERTRRGLVRAEAALARAAGWEGSGRVEGWRVQLLVLAHSLSLPQREELARRLAADRPLRRLLRDAPGQVRRALRALARRERLGSGMVHRSCAELGSETLLAAAALAPSSRARRALLRYAERRGRLRLDIDGGALLDRGVAPGPALAAGLLAAQCARLDGRAVGREQQLRVALRAARRA